MLRTIYFCTKKQTEEVCKAECTVEITFLYVIAPFLEDKSKFTAYKTNCTRKSVIFGNGASAFH